MKWRDWQLLIILVLLFYVGIGIALLPREKQDPSSAVPIATAGPTSPISPQTVVIRRILPTKTPPPTRTPRPALLPTSTPPSSTLPPLPTITAAPAVSLTPSPSPTAEIVTYVVQQGDNLTGIAERHGTTLQALVRANDLGNADLIYPGQVLIIKVIPWASPTPAPTAP